MKRAISSKRKPATNGGIVVVPATAARAKDLERLFGPRGACGGCWCMWWRRSASEFAAGKGIKNRNALRRLLKRGAPVGVIAYRAQRPIGWCAVAPRADLERLNRSRVLAPVDEQRVWAVTCFYLERAARGQKLTVTLLKAACEFARRQGATLVEGYPIDPGRRRIPAVFAYTGLVSAFRAAGFEEVARRSPTRPIMRRSLGENGGTHTKAAKGAKKKTFRVSL